MMPSVYSGIVQTRHYPKCQECHQRGFCASGKGKGSGAIPHLNYCKYIKLENEFALQNSGALCGGIYWVVKYDQRRCNLLEAPRHVTAHYGETFPFSIWSGDLVRQRQETHKIA